MLSVYANNTFKLSNTGLLSTQLLLGSETRRSHLRVACRSVCNQDQRNQAINAPFRS